MKVNKEVNYYVYALIDPRNNQPFYIGKGQILDAAGRRYRRLYEHINSKDISNTFKDHIVKKLKKLGTPALTKIIKENISEAESFELEISLIKKYGRRDNGEGQLTNLTDGGEGFSGRVLTEDQKMVISIRNKEYYKTHDNPFLGKTHTKETIEKIREANIEWQKNHDNAFLGKKHKPSAKKKISNARKLKGATLPESEWYKYGIKNKGRNNPSSKKYKFISPDGNEFIVEGAFIKFTKDHNLALTLCKKSINKGIIPETKNPNHNRMSKERLNTTGWEIIRI